MKKTHAGVYSPMMEAVLNGLFRFADIADARMRMNYIRSTFVIPKEQPPEPEKLLLWIKDYALTDEEVKEGLKGNFAEIAITKIEDTWTLSSTKIALPLSKHPQKKRKPMSCPDWGHPVIRASQKNYIYPTLEEAQGHLAKMHADFPKVSIPGNNRLFIMIYRRPQDGKGESVKKYILLIKAAKEGGFHIVTEENTRKPSELKDKEKMGKFTSLVALKKPRRTDM